MVKTGELYACSTGKHWVVIQANCNGMPLERVMCAICNSPLMADSVINAPASLDPARIFERLCYIADKKLLRDMEIAVDWE